MNDFRIRLGEPVTVAYDPKEYRFDWDWGYYQFPAIGRGEDGTIVCTFNVCDDSFTAFGKKNTTRTYRSTDDGVTWTPAPEDARICTRLPGGTFLSTTTVLSPAPSEVPGLGEPDFDFLHERATDDPGAEKVYRRESYWYYRTAPEDLRRWAYLRKEPGGEWQLCRPVVEMPEDALLISMNGFLLRYMFEKFRLTPDGKVIGCYYPVRADGYDGRPGSCPTFFLSGDDAKSFQYLGRIPYEPDPRFDIRRFPALTGFSEPVLEFLPDGTAVCLLRTHEDDVKSPSYLTRSFDGGRTWEKPRVFDEELGVFPQLLHLRCGVTLATYGRPGVFVRGTDDPEALRWQDRVTVLDSRHTCSYTGILALGDASALMIYSDFARIQADGKPHKSLVVRRIDVE